MANTLTALEAGALRVALLKLLDESRHFSICDFEQMCKVYGAYPIPRDLDALRLLHCVDWRKMDAATKREARAVIFRTFAPDEQTAEAFASTFEEPTAQKVSMLRRLLGGAAQ